MSTVPSEAQIKSMSVHELANHINKIIQHRPRTFPEHWNLKAVVVERDTELYVTLKHSEAVNTSSVWSRFDLCMCPYVSSRVS